MNDLPDVLEHCSVTLYAEDTVLYFASKSFTKSFIAKLFTVGISFASID